MSPDRDILVDLIHTLLRNARDLVDDARVLLDLGRFPRAFALAVLAGEELGKVAPCLGQLMGDTTSPSEFRHAWRSHSEKIHNMAAYQIAFTLDPDVLQGDDAGDPMRDVGRRKMTALYVDFTEAGIVTPAAISANEARKTVEMADAAISHASANLGQLTSEVAAGFALIAPLLNPHVDKHVGDMQPADVVLEIRRLLDLVLTVTEAQWASALSDGSVAALLGFDAGAR